MQAWSPFYWADYVADTAHLSLVEHGAYFLLMAHYYNTGKPLLANAKALLRIARAETEEEKVAVASVLAAFFHLEGEIYRHRRIDRELAKGHEISQLRRNSGRKGGLAKAKANATILLEQKASILQPQSQPQRTSTKAKASSAFELPTWIPQEAWDHYEEMRRRIRKPMTDQARKWAIAALDKLRVQGSDPAEVLEQSVFNSWQGLFALRSDSHDGYKTTAQRRNERSSAALDRAFGEEEATGSVPKTLHQGSR